MKRSTQFQGSAAFANGVRQRVQMLNDQELDGLIEATEQALERMPAGVSSTAWGYRYTLDAAHRERARRAAIARVAVASDDGGATAERVLAEWRAKRATR